ncbi:MAG: Asp-tRNA(Asn)/Glu-tRNA(Gln) amidotransferase subunit GatA [bacterium]
MKPFITIKELKEKISNEEITPEESTNFFHNRLKKHDKKILSCLEIFEPQKIKSNGPLAGIPGLLKDNICQKGKIASCASKILQNYKAPYDSTATQRMTEAGASILGRTNMDEFAMGSSGEYSAYQITKNPWDLTRVPGGSCSGSAAAVAAGLVPWALGSETGGSVRTPAAFCGIVGMYPTYGLSSRFGVVAFASSTDQIAPLTRTVYDNATIASSLFGHDKNDSTTLDQKQKDYTKNLDGKLPKNLTIGVLQEALDSKNVDPQIKTSFQNAIKQLEKLGAKIKPVKLENLKYGIAVYYILAPAEAASNLNRYDGTLYGLRNKSAKTLEEMYTNTRHEGFGVEVKRRILMGNFVLSEGYKDAYYNKANKIRNMIRAEFGQTFKDVDLIASPTTATLPFKIGQNDNNPMALYMADYFTVCNCLTGNPAISIPCGFSKENLPIGFQFIGPRLSEELLYKVSYAFEQSTDYHLKTPKGFE